MTEKTPAQSVDEVMASLRNEFIERANDHLDELDTAIRAAQHDAGGNFPDEYEFRRRIHSLKGSGGTFGFPLVTVIAHRLEDYMSEVGAIGDHALEGIQVFVDRIRDNIDGKGAAEDAAEIARALPIASIPDFDVVKVDMEVMLISPKDIASHIISRELQECGFRVVNVPSPFEALEQIALTKPDLAIATAVLEGLSGVDLACAVRAMPATRALRFALMTSFEPGHDALKALPKDVPIIRKGPDLPDDLAEVLYRFEMT
ncbi:MAG: hypothetical protein HOB82_06740 [Alphaproteobacteria bacterium]|nr:hypothetical protein [Alphaproteobacteria bacterium]MBT4711207.1 hypothetical protein [Alphaproteobacteria bacterium]